MTPKSGQVALNWEKVGQFSPFGRCDGVIYKAVESGLVTQTAKIFIHFTLHLRGLLLKGGLKKVKFDLVNFH